MKYESLEKLSYKNPQFGEEVYASRFNSPYTFHIDFLIHSAPAFYEEIPEVSHLIAQIYKTERFISVLCTKLPGVALDQFSRRCLIDEIVLTNNIEGVISTRKDIRNVLDSLEKRDRKKRFHGLVQKYEMLRNNPSIHLKTCQDIRDIYDELVLNEIKEADKDSIPDGEIFRKEAVYVHSSTQRVIHKGLYPESEIQTAMEKALRFLNEKNVEPLIRISIFHYLLGYIHPFYDGNGRLSRFISSYLLSKEVSPLLGYRLSYTIRESVKDYYAAFKTCNNPRSCGELTPFLLYFLGIVKTAMEQLLNALRKRFNLLTLYSSRLDSLPFVSNSRQLSKLGHFLIQAELFSENGISTKELINYMEVSRATLTKLLSVYESQGLLTTRKVRRENCYTIKLSKLDQLSEAVKV